MQFVVTASGKPDYFEDRVSVGDKIKYELDFSPWLEGKGTIASTVWQLNAGSAAFADTDQSALITFGSKGYNVLSCLVTTTTGEAKKVWMTIKSSDGSCLDDYGFPG